LTKLIAKEAVTKEENREPVAALLQGAILLALIAPGIRSGDLSGSVPLLETVSGNLRTALEQLNGSEDIPQHAQIFFQQAAIALESGDADMLLSTLENGVELTGAIIDNFTGDVKDLKNTSINVNNSITNASSSNASTDFSIGA
jgi:hypothetical protein